MRVIPKPNRRVKANQTSIFLIIHLPKTPSASVSWRRAGAGRDKIAPVLVEHEKRMCSGSGLSHGLVRKRSVSVGHDYPEADIPIPFDSTTTPTERKLLGHSVSVRICCDILSCNGSWCSGTPKF